MSDVSNFWASGTPFGGGNFSRIKRSAQTLDGYLSPITVRRIIQDPSTWKQALEEAEILTLPYRVRMQQMYMDTVLDPHTWSCIDRRKKMVELKDYMICDGNGVQDDKATQIINQPWFRTIISYVLDAKFYGYSLIGLGNIIDGRFEKISLMRRANISPDRLTLAPTPYMPVGIEFMNPEAKDDKGNSFYDWTLWVPTPSDFGLSDCGYGLLYKVALHQIIARNNLGDNAAYNELFGQPFRVGKTSSTDATKKADFSAALRDMGSSGWALIDENDLIEYHEASSGGKGTNVYENLENRLTKNITKVILGHEDAMSSTPGKLGAQGKDLDAVGKALRDTEKSDCTFAEEYVNDVVIPKLLKLGFRIPVGKVFRYKNDKELQETKKIEDENNAIAVNNFKILSDAGYKVDPKFIEERTGIPVEEKEDPEQMVNNPNIPKEVKNAINKLYGVK